MSSTKVLLSIALYITKGNKSNALLLCDFCHKYNDIHIYIYIYYIQSVYYALQTFVCMCGIIREMLRVHLEYTS